MNPETVNAIKEALVPIAEKIGQGAEFGWEVVLRQQYVSAVGYFLVAGVAFIAICVGVGLIVAGLRYEKRGSFDDGKFARIAFGLVSSVGGLLFFAGAVFNGMARLINPEYYALQFFITLGQSNL